MTVKIHFSPENPTVELNSSKGTKIATISVTDMPEGVKPEFHLVNNAGHRVVLNGTDILLAENLIDASDMHVQVELEVNGSFVDNMLVVKVNQKKPPVVVTVDNVPTESPPNYPRAGEEVDAKNAVKDPTGKKTEPFALDKVEDKPIPKAPAKAKKEKSEGHDW